MLVARKRAPSRMAVAAAASVGEIEGQAAPDHHGVGVVPGRDDLDAPALQGLEYPGPPTQAARVPGASSEAAAWDEVISSSGRISTPRPASRAT